MLPGTRASTRKQVYNIVSPTTQKLLGRAIARGSVQPVGQRKGSYFAFYTLEHRSDQFLDALMIDLTTEGKGRRHTHAHITSSAVHRCFGAVHERVSPRACSRARVCKGGGGMRGGCHATTTHRLFTHTHAACTCAHMHTYTHTYMHTYTHTCMHTHTHSYTHTHMHTYTHTCMHTYTPWLR